MNKISSNQSMMKKNVSASREQWRLTVTYQQPLVWNFQNMSEKNGKKVTLISVISQISCQDSLQDVNDWNKTKDFQLILVKQSTSKSKSKKKMIFRSSPAHVVGSWVFGSKFVVDLASVFVVVDGEAGVFFG